MKRILSALLCLVMLAVITACGAKAKVPALDEAAQMRDYSELLDALSDCGKGDLRAAWGEPDYADEEYAVDVWYVDTGDRQLIVQYDADGAVMHCFFGIE